MSANYPSATQQEVDAALKKLRQVREARERVAAPIEEKRMTTVHGRYHVAGFFENDWYGELIGACQTKAEAFTLARRSIGPRWYARTTVFDSMAHNEAARVWDSEGKRLL